MKTSKRIIELATEKVCDNVRSINIYWEKSHSVMSAGWDGEKINDNDLVIDFTVKIMGDEFIFTALHLFNQDRCAYNETPELVKVNCL